jgi:heparan-alpha-glucosaminide N-acetyltransferase
MTTAPLSPTPSLPQRLASLDAYRGLVMFLLMAEVLRFGSVAEAFPESGFWAFLHQQQSHVKWVGCSLHDMIQPSFSFIVGVALPFSIAARMAKGQSRTRLSIHAFWRALLLILLGVFLRSTGQEMTKWTFEDTLSQIGLGYGFLFLIGFGSMRVQWGALATILVGYWLAFALYPLPGANFDWTSIGITAAYEYNLTGFAAHWNLNTNFAWAFDTWFMNLFPRETPFLFNRGGYSTLSFIPTLGTMILGLIAGEVLRSEKTPKYKVQWLVIAGIACLFLGWLLGALGICPVVKKIWTPSWVLFSGGWCILLLAAFYAIIDMANVKGWTFPLTVIGMNSIAAYFITEMLRGFVGDNIKTHLGQNFFAFAGAGYEPLFHGMATLLVMWLMLFWMYRRKIFLRI